MLVERTVFQLYINATYRGAIGKEVDGITEFVTDNKSQRLIKNS